MSTRILVSLAGSAVITSALMLGLASTGSAPALPSNTTGGLPVTDLPGITVTASVPNLASRHAHGHGLADSAAASDHASHSLFDHVGKHISSPHLRMPYYSFGSPTASLGKD